MILVNGKSVRADWRWKKKKGGVWWKKESRVQLGVHAFCSLMRESANEIAPCDGRYTIIANCSYIGTRQSFSLSLLFLFSPPIHIVPSSTHARCVFIVQSPFSRRTAFFIVDSRASVCNIAGSDQCNIRFSYLTPIAPIVVSSARSNTVTIVCRSLIMISPVTTTSLSFSVDWT